MQNRSVYLGWDAYVLCAYIPTNTNAAIEAKYVFLDGVGFEYHLVSNRTALQLNTRDLVGFGTSEYVDTA